MAVKVLMKRVPTVGRWIEMNDVLRELRLLAMTQPGYISGETLLSATDQGTTMVISTWASVTDWKVYEESEDRKEILAELQVYLAKSVGTEIWVESPVIG